MGFFTCIFHSILYFTCKQELITWKVSPLNLVKHEAEERRKRDGFITLQRKKYLSPKNGICCHLTVGGRKTHTHKPHKLTSEPSKNFINYFFK